MPFDPIKLFEFSASIIFAAGAAYAGASLKITNLGNGIDDVKRSIESMREEMSRSISNAHARIDQIYDRTQKILIQRQEL